MGGREGETSDIVCRPRKLIDAIKSWRMCLRLPLLFLTFSLILAVCHRPDMRQATQTRNQIAKSPKKKRKKTAAPSMAYAVVCDTIRRRNSKIYYPDNCALL